MKKKAYLKDCRKMFKNNFTRFISIVLIIILGTAFFVGMNAVAPAMEDDAEKYMKEIENIKKKILKNSKKMQM